MVIIFSRFHSKNTDSFLKHFEFGVNTRLFFSRGVAPSQTQVHYNMITINIDPTGETGGSIVSPGLQALYKCQLIRDRVELILGYSYHRNIISKKIELSKKFPSGNDISFLFKGKKTAVQVLWLNHINGYCETFKDTIYGRNYTIPDKFRNICIATVSYSDSISRNIHMKQYISGWFTKDKTYINGYPHDSIHTNSLIIGIVLNTKNF